MFDLSMQSALDIFCYVLVLIYGLALSADISTGGHVSRQQKYLLTLLCLLFLLVQGLGLVLLGERTVKQLYPLVIHVPLVLILILFMKKSVGVAIVSTCTAYLCCQPPRWGRIAVEALTQSTLAAELVYILLMPVMYYLLRRFFVAAAYNTMTSSTAALLLFGSLPVTYYIFDYATTIYSDALYSGIQALNEFLPTVLITFYVLFLPAFHLQSQRRADAEMQRSMLEAELDQSQSEMDSLHRLETQTAVYQHDMRHHLQVLSGLAEQGDAEGVLPDTVRPSLPGLCHDVFGSGTGRNPAWMAWLFSHFCCPDSVVAASSVLGRCPFVAFLFRPLRGIFPLSCIPRCAAGTCGRTPVNKKGHPHGAGGP